MKSSDHTETGIDSVAPSACVDTVSEIKVLRPFDRNGAASYDDDAKALARRYKTAHSIQNELVHAFLTKAGSGSSRVVVDFGCGTATDGLKILSGTSWSMYLGVDNSHHMLARAGAKLTNAGYEHRTHFMERDFRRLSFNEVMKTLQKRDWQFSIACIISALALHHYSLAEKEGVYRLAFDLLPQGGLFVITDLFSNRIGHCDSQALLKELDDIRTAAKRLSRKTNRLDSTISERHYLEENKPEVLVEEIASLQKIGFAKVDILYRSAQLAVVAAEK